MIFFPAIDIKDGKCIRLTQGLLKSLTIYNNDPIKQANKFEELGCKWIHIVDIDGAFSGKSINHELIFEIKKNTKCKIQMGGGIRSIKTIESLVENDIERIILGTVALNDPELVKTACKLFPKKIVVGLDAKNNKVAVEGWSKTSEIKDTDLIKMYEDVGVSAVVYTDISRDGLLSGINIKSIKNILNSSSINIIASGGVGSKEDILELLQIEDKNLEGVICGKAIYEGKINVVEILRILNRESNVKD